MLVGELCHLIKTAAVYTCMYHGSCFCHITVVSNDLTMCMPGLEISIAIQYNNLKTEFCDRSARSRH